MTQIADVIKAAEATRNVYFGFGNRLAAKGHLDLAHNEMYRAMVMHTLAHDEQLAAMFTGRLRKVQS